MKVAVLGAGPAGLLASWAVIDAGHELTTFEKSPRKPDGLTAGVYYLHSDCNLPLRRREVDVIGSGGTTEEERRENYRRKVYGEQTVPVSIPGHRQTDIAYDGMQALALCWDVVHPFIVHEKLRHWIDVVGLSKNYDLVVNTVPLNALLPDIEWRYEQATIYRGVAPPDESYMLYQASPAVPWYRASAMFGVFTMEYAMTYRDESMRLPPKEEGQYVRVKKVIDTPESMPVLPDNVMLTGRFGAWSKSNLSHHAYEHVMRRLS